MKEYNLTFTEDEMNYIINAIASRPYNEAYKYINNIQQQLQKAEEANTKTPNVSND